VAFFNVGLMVYHFSRRFLRKNVSASHYTQSKETFKSRKHAGTRNPALGDSNFALLEEGVTNHLCSESLFQISENVRSKEGSFAAVTQEVRRGWRLAK
jgi:hypothetical protein